MYMNIQEMTILRELAGRPFSSQRELAEACGCALGIVNKSLRSLENQGYLNSQKELTAEAEKWAAETAPRRAVILAAGFGMRMVPINMEQPKALLKVRGEVLIERLIRQLQEAGIREIYVVVGFMKEQFEYLMDQFGVELVVNPRYAACNNLHSLSLVREKLGNCYVLPCDLWCRENPFRQTELYSWYLVKSGQDQRSEVRVNRRQELVKIEKGQMGNAMVGICYLTARDAILLGRSLEMLAGDSRYDQAFWEEALYEKGKMTVAARVIPQDQVIEINTYEQLRELDSHSQQLENQAITRACQALKAAPAEIRNITVLKKGMTNRSFLFTCREQKYIMRIPGEGTDQLINRREEAAVYGLIRDKKLCDDILFIDPDNGYKITRYISGARCCDPENPEDLRRCMAFLKAFHRQKLKVSHSFDLFGKIAFYESLWEGRGSAYRDYETTKENVYSLKAYLESHAGQQVLTHIDAVADNFLLFKDADGEEKIRLIDWEYAAMQDPHVDIAMFCIYALYDRTEVDQLIDIYFENQCTPENRIKIYGYVAVCGLLWSNWCEYKRNLGVEFGEYSLRQYRYAKEFYRYAAEGMKAL